MGVLLVYDVTDDKSFASILILDARHVLHFISNFFVHFLNLERHQKLDAKY